MSGKRILVLDDVAEVRQLLADSFSEEGFEVDSVESAGELVAALSSARPTYDFVLLDLDLGPEAPPIATCLDLLHREGGVLAASPLLDRLGTSADRPVSGRFLLPVVKLLSPPSVVFVLTGDDRDPEAYHELKELGADEVVYKLTADSEITDGRSSKNLCGELLSLVGKHEEQHRPRPRGRSHRRRSRPRKVAQLGTLETVLHSYDRELTLKDFLRYHVERWPEDCGVRAEILYLNERQRLLEQIAEEGFRQVRDAMRVRLVSNGDFTGLGLCNYAAVSGESVLVNRVEFDSRYLHVQEASEDRTESELVVPLRSRGRLVGLLNLEADVPLAFTHAHLDYFERLSPVLALMIEHETFKREEELLTEGMGAIAGEVDQERVLALTLERVLRLVGAHSVGGMLVPTRGEDGSPLLKVVASQGLTLKEGEQWPLSRFGIIRRAWDSPSGRAYESEVDEDPDYVPLAEGIHSEYALVVRVGQEAVAVLDVESRAKAISERFQGAIERLVAYASTHLRSLQRSGSREREAGVAATLEGLRREAHLLKSHLAVLDQRTSSLPQEVGNELRRLTALASTRLASMDRVLRGLQEPSRPLDLRTVLDKVRALAAGLGVDLEVDCPPRLEIEGNEAAIHLLFDNLVVNTARHASDAPRKKAWARARRRGQLWQLQYWDDGEAPRGASGLVRGKLAGGREAGQGTRDIVTLCQELSWIPSTDRHPDGSLQWCFELLARGGS